LYLIWHYGTVRVAALLVTLAAIADETTTRYWSPSSAALLNPLNERTDAVALAIFVKTDEPTELAAIVLVPAPFPAIATNTPPPYATPHHRALAGSDRCTHTMPSVLLATVFAAPAPVLATAKNASSPKET
jgi:hypothetical protein